MRASCSPSSSSTYPSAANNHIIDPSYSRSGSTQLYVYVDDSGAHDPDYRHFPLVSTAPKIITPEEDNESLEFDPIELRRVHSQGAQRRRSSVSPPPSSTYSRSSFDESRPSSQHGPRHLKRISHPPITSFFDIEPDDEAVEEEDETVQTCQRRPRSPSLKMRWHALMLGIQLGAFRASKHVRRRSSSG